MALKKIFTTRVRAIVIAAVVLAILTALAVLLRQPPRAPQWVEDDD